MNESLSLKQQSFANLIERKRSHLKYGAVSGVKYGGNKVDSYKQALRLNIMID